MAQISSRKPLLACLISLFLPGLGQIYCGELVRGCSLLIFFCLIPLVIARITVSLPDEFMLAGMVCAAGMALFIYLFACIDSWFLARRTPLTYQLRNYNSTIFYGAIWLAGLALMSLADTYLKENVVEAYRIVGTSMEPTVLQGDFVLADKTAYRHESIRRGDIVIVVYPDDRSKVLIRRIEGLPGDTINQGAGAALTVPHGSAMIKGSAGSVQPVDSSTFGPVDLRDIVAKVTQVYFSRDDQGIRWRRIGLLINPAEPH